MVLVCVCLLQILSLRLYSSLGMVTTRCIAGGWTRFVNQSYWTQYTFHIDCKPVGLLMGSATLQPMKSTAETRVSKFVQKLGYVDRGVRIHYRHRWDDQAISVQSVIFTSSVHPVLWTRYQVLLHTAENQGCTYLALEAISNSDECILFCRVVTVRWEGNDVRGAGSILWCSRYKIAIYKKFRARIRVIQNCERVFFIPSTTSQSGALERFDSLAHSELMAERCVQQSLCMFNNEQKYVLKVSSFIVLYRNEWMWDVSLCNPHCCVVCISAIDKSFLLV
jgi:hypothetical protein